MPDTGGTWLKVEVDHSALRHNMEILRQVVVPEARTMAVVKANAYGHGLLPAARAFLEGGADMLGVHSVAELLQLRSGGIAVPVLVLGPADAREVLSAAGPNTGFTVGSLGMLEDLARLPVSVAVHLKVETGVNRQGITEQELEAALRVIKESGNLDLVGVSSHFADIEDTTDHEFATGQMERFEGYRRRLSEAGFRELEHHMSCSAAALLWDRTHRSVARLGISAYGIWPSRETLVSVRQRGRPELDLRPALTWKVRIAQIRGVPAGQTVGYGRAWKAMTDSRIAVLPVGYADGWPRALSGRAHVLIGGKRAPLVGRICMNLCMADVTCIPDARAGRDAVLLGRQGDEVITAETVAGWLGTIPYEVLTLPRETWRRIPA